MSFNLFPNEETGSAYELDYEAYYAKGYRGIIFDIDNTLVPHNAPADARAAALFARLHGIGFKTLILSNNKEPRVNSFTADAGADMYIFHANKPITHGYLKSMELMGTDTDSTLFIGDQIFTDIWGARRAGIYSILTAPVDKWHEEIQIILKRILEAPIIFIYRIYSGRKRRSQ